MELQKQPILATKEQLRLAELTQTGNEMTTAHDDIALQKRVKKVIELTRCTPSQAEVALIDSEQNVESAVALLLDKPGELVLWSQQGKNKKPRSSAQANDSMKSAYGSQGRRVDSQRVRTHFNEQQSGGKQSSVVQSRSARFSQSREKDTSGPRARSERPFKGQGRIGGGYRRDQDMKNADGTQRNVTGKTDNENESGWNDGGYNGWTNGGTGGDWGDSAGWGEEKKSGVENSFSNAEAPYTDSLAANKKDDEWKNGPRIFMPSSAVTTVVTSETSVNVRSSANWPALDGFVASSAAESSDLLQKPKTFAAVAASKKTAVLIQPNHLQRQQQQQAASSTVETPVTTEANVSSFQKEETRATSTQEAMRSEEPSVEWSSSIEWGNSLSPQPAAAVDQEFVKHPSESLASTSSSSAFATSMNINQEYTDQLKNAIGLVQNNQQQQLIGAAGSVQPSASSMSSCITEVDYMQHRMQQMQQQPSNDSSDLDQHREKVEFVTGDSLPPTSTSYQFGFHFDSAKELDAWGQQNISTVEVNRSVLKSSTGDVLSSAMANVPTTSSSVSAHFSASSHQTQPIESQRIISSRGGTSLSFTDAASVNFPPSNGQPGAAQTGFVGGNAVQSSALVAAHSSAAPLSVQQMQQNKPMYTPANPSTMVTAPPHMQQHLQQQQPQAMFHHQTSAAAAAVPQFPNYNMPYMYSPVAAPTLPAPNSELDRFLLSQGYGAPYSQLDLQMGAMSLGPPTTLAPNHRATLDSYMDNKFGQQQQQNAVGQGANAGSFQQTHQQNQQQQRSIGQSDTAALLGGPPGHVGPPPGFGMPTAPTQTSYMAQPANLQSLFQMPTYHHNPYQHHQYMMSNANRLQSMQRPAQTSPPDVGGGQPQRRVNDPQGYSGTGADSSAGEQHSNGSGQMQQYASNNYSKYRSYM